MLWGAFNGSLELRAEGGATRLTARFPYGRETEIAPGRFEVIECDAASLGAELARLNPAEVVAAEGSGEALAASVERPKAGFDSAKGEERLKALFGVATLDGFGSFSRAALSAAGGLVAYLDHTAKGSLPFLRPPRVRHAAGAGSR